MPSYSVLNVPANYSVSQELALVFISSWAAWVDGNLLGFFATRTLAEHTCAWHYAESLCHEEA